MEFSGGNGAALMQTWITEEFAYISSKRNLGISDLKEERHIRQRLQLPEFNGRNCEDWVSEMEDIFHFFHLSEEAKLKAAILSLDGGAQWWFEWEHRRRPFYEWQELKGVVARLFGPSSQVVHSDLTRLGYQVRHYGYPMSFSGGSDGIEDGGARLSTFASRDNVAGTQLGSGLDGLPQLSGSGGGPGNSGGGIGSGQGCLVKDGFRGDHGYGGAGYFDSSADERKWVRISGGEDDWVVGGSPNGGPGEGVGMVVIGGAGGSRDGPGTGEGSDGLARLTGRGGRFVKGGADMSGSGGGPGGCLGGRLGGKRELELQLKISELMYAGSFVHCHLGLERKQILEEASKDNLVNVLKGDIIAEVGLSVPCDFKSHLHPNKYQNASLEEMRPDLGLKSARPNLSQFLRSTYSTPNLSPINFNFHFSFLRSNSLTHSPKPASHFIPSTPISQTQFLQPKLSSFQSITHATLLSNQSNLLPKPHYTPHSPVILNDNILRKPHSMSSYHDPKNQFPIASLTKKVRGTINEELERQWKPGINVKDILSHCYQGRSFTANYYPP